MLFDVLNDEALPALSSIAAAYIIPVSSSSQRPKLICYDRPLSKNALQFVQNQITLFHGEAIPTLRNIFAKVEDHNFAKLRGDVVCPLQHFLLPRIELHH